MSWQALTLAQPSSSALALDGALNVFEVSPFSAGVAEGDGLNRWLSFPNAVAAIKAKLAGQPIEAVFCVGVTAGNLGDLAVQAGLLNGAFNLKQLQQWQRHAANLAALESTKMLLNDNEAASGELALNALPTIKTAMQKALDVQGIADAVALKAANPLANLNSFATAAADFAAQVNTPLSEPAGSHGWRFYADSDVLNQLSLGHPGDEYSYAAVLVFTGSASELNYLRELMP